MTHISEETFTEEYVKPWLFDRHHPNDVDEQHWVSETGGFVDFWITDGIVTKAVEVGNDESVRDECAQAMEYATNDVYAVPVVIIPAGHGDTAVVQNWRQRGLVIHELKT